MKVMDYFANNRFDKEIIMNDLVRIIENMEGDWEMEFGEQIGPETFLVADLAFKSINVAQLAATIGEHFQKKRLPFQKLIMPDCRVVKDLQVSDIVDFLYVHLNKY